MICVVLAAGYATRLYPLTKSFPKPLLEISGKSILDWLVDDVDSTGRAEAFIIVSNRVYAGHFRAWARDKRLSAPVTVIDDGSTSNETRLGAVNDMLLALSGASGGRDWLVMAGDNVLDFSLSPFIDYAISKPCSCAMRYFEPDAARLRRAGVAEIGEGDVMLRMVEKPANPVSNWCVPPFYYYKARDVEILKKAVENGCATDAPGSALAWLGAKTPVCLMEMPGKRYDIGTLASYEEVKRVYKGRVTV